MPLEPSACGAHDARRLVGAESHVPGPERQHQVVAQGALPVGDRLIDHVGHPRIALEPRRRRRVVAVVAGTEELHAGDQIGEHDLGDPGLAERRQHPLDVAQEHPVRPDDEHPLVFEREPVGVEQIRGAVQGHDGLAGAGSTLHHQHPGLRRTDDLVLLALDGGDDVAEGARAAAFERGQQRRVAAQLVLTDGIGAAIESLVVADPEVPLAEQLVFDAEQLLALDGEMPAPGDAHRIATGGAVERFGDGCPPVDHDGLAVFVGHRQPADVEALEPVGRLRVPVDPPEDQRGIAEVEVGQPLHQRLVERVALEAGLERAAEIGLGHVAHTPRRRTTGVQAVVRVIDVCLLCGKIRVLLGHNGTRQCYRPTGQLRIRPPTGG